MRVFVQVAICLALTSLAGFSSRLAAQPVTLHEQQRISLSAPYARGAFDVCVRGDDLLALALRNGPEPIDAVWALVHFRKQADGEWLQTRISEAYTEWTVRSGEFEGRTGYGMSEYLDQIIDGAPVGLAE